MSHEDQRQQKDQRLRSGKPFRLPSLSSNTRDLSLSPKPKRSFIPNIPPRRERSADSVPLDGARSSLRRNTQVKSESVQRSRKRCTRSRCRQSDVVQTSSIFQDVPEDMRRDKPVAGRYVRTDVAVTSHDVIVKKDTRDTDDELSDLLQDNFVVNERLVTKDKSLLPVELTFLDQPQTDSKQKQEPVSQSRQHRSGDSPSNVFMSGADDGKFFLLQLPDVLPTQQTNKQGGGQHVKGSLDSLDEGCIGKLRVHRSGKVHLLIGGVSFDVFPGSPVHFLQQLVSVRQPASTATTHMSVLGNVSDKLICVPQLLDDYT